MNREDMKTRTKQFGIRVVKLVGACGDFRCAIFDFRFEEKS